MDLFDDERPEINLDKYEQNNFNNLGFDVDGYDECGFNKHGIHKNGTLFDDFGFDQFGFDELGFDQCKNYYDRFDLDYLGYERIYIQKFLMELRSLLNINHLLNVFCVIKFNEDLEDYLEENNLSFKQLIKKKLKNYENKLCDNHLKTFKFIYQFDIY